MSKIDSLDTSLRSPSNLQKPENLKVNEKEALKVKEAARQFESLLLHQMLNSMTANTGTDDLLGGSREQEFSKDLYNQALAESIAEGKGIGIKDVLIRDFSKKYKGLAKEGE